MPDVSSGALDGWHDRAAAIPRPGDRHEAVDERFGEPRGKIVASSQT